MLEVLLKDRTIAAPIKINIRKLIGVKKTHNPKGMGLFLYAYVIQKKLNNPCNIEKSNHYYFELDFHIYINIGTYI